MSTLPSAPVLWDFPRSGSQNTNMWSVNSTDNPHCSLLITSHGFADGSQLETPGNPLCISLCSSLFSVLSPIVVAPHWAPYHVNPVSLNQGDSQTQCGVPIPSLLSANSCWAIHRAVVDSLTFLPSGNTALHHLLFGIQNFFSCIFFSFFSFRLEGKSGPYCPIKAIFKNIIWGCLSVSAS